MTCERLYYDDAYLREFAATVTARGQRDGRLALALDRSAFYPEGGGQPADYGTLGGVAVVDVQTGAGEVWHVLADQAPALQVGSALTGAIDWARRFGHMQQHHGQHLLTAAFVATCGVATVSFHLGETNVTIDLAAPGLSEAQVRAAEELANQIIWEDRPVEARFVAAEELAQLPLRKPPTVAGPVRVVSVADFDYSACGGTHPRTTGGVGAIVVQRWTRYKELTRLSFACGGRALRDYRRLAGVAGRTAAALSVGPDELEAAVMRLRSAQEASLKELEEVRGQLLAREATELLANGRAVGSARVVCQLLHDITLERMRALGQHIAAASGGIALLGLLADGRSHLLVACAPDSGQDARVLLGAGLDFIGGRGGGSAQLAQGGGPANVDLSAALAAMEQRISLSVVATHQ